MEIFKDVKGYEGLYQVSNLGNVKSLSRKRSPRVFIMKKSLGSCGRYVVGFKKDKKSKNHYIHQLVAIAFLNHTPNGHAIVVDHIDNNPLNNNLNNLQIITNRENNTKDRVNKNGLTGVCKLKIKYKTKSGKEKEYVYFSSMIYINGKSVFLGSYKTKEEAAKKYQDKLAELK